MNIFPKNKKALTASLLVKAVIAIIVLFMISLIFFIGGDSQFAQIKKILPKFSSELHPNEYSNSDIRFASTEEKTKEVFRDLLQGIEALSDQSCDKSFYFLESGLDYSALDDGIWIRIDAKNGGGMDLLLENVEKKSEKQLKKNHLYSQTGVPKAQDSSTLTPCIIMSASATKFVKSTCMNYVNDITKTKKKFTNNYDFSCEPFKQLIIKGSRIYLDGERITGISFGSDDYHLTLMRNGNNIAFFISESTTIFSNKCEVGNKKLLSSKCFTTNAQLFYEGSCDYNYYETNSKTCTSLNKKIDAALTTTT